MLLFATVPSFLLMFAVNGAARMRSQPVGKAAAVGVVGSWFAGCCVGGLFPVVMLQAVLVAIAVAIWKRTDRSPGRLFRYTLTATTAAYLTVGAFAVRNQIEYQELRDRFPYESLDGRLPVVPPGPPAPFDDIDLKETERSTRELTYSFYGRGYELQNLHERSLKAFVNAPGFGVGRMMGQPSAQGLTRDLRTAPAPLQPPHPTYPADGDPRPPGQPEEMELNRVHRLGVADFVHPDGFGYVKDRQHVAGFQSHRFNKVPEGTGVGVARLELVSLLLHKEPAVYVSDRLPQMDALKGVPTRPPDEFETEGLAALRAGKTLFQRDDRLLGAVRATQQCVACHGGQRGDLLGAFSYVLRR